MDHAVQTNRQSYLGAATIEQIAQARSQRARRLLRHAMGYEESAQARLAAAKALRDTFHENPIPKLLTYYYHNPFDSHSCRRDAIQTILELDPQSALKHLTPVLTDKRAWKYTGNTDKDRRVHFLCAALEAFQTNPVPGAWKSIAPLLSHPHYQTQEFAYMAILSNAHPDALEPLARAKVHNEPGPTHTIDALGQLTDHLLSRPEFALHPAMQKVERGLLPFKRLGNDPSSLNSETTGALARLMLTHPRAEHPDVFKRLAFIARHAPRRDGQDMDVPNHTLTALFRTAFNPGNAKLFQSPTTFHLYVHQLNDANARERTKVA